MTNPTKYILFADRNNDKVANAGEMIETFTITRGNEVSKLCAVISGSEQCSDTSGLNNTNVTFVRPNPEGYINTNLGAASELTVYLTSPGGTERRVVVRTTGQISVERP